MIFVTVGTHEQPFNRLIQKVDELVEKNIINEKVIIQKGYSTYMPVKCEAYDLLEYDKMQELIRDARIVISHGGPASFIAPLSIGKIPIVVPRMKKYEEHVNDHQLNFAKELEKRNKNIIVVEDENDLENIIQNYDRICEKLKNNMKSNNKKFVEMFKSEIEKMF